jgi:hypothetical protein
MVDNRQKRNFFRIEYPIAEYAFFEFMGHKLKVLDLSEQGVQVEFSSATLPVQSARFNAKIHLCHGGCAEVEGVAVRFIGSKAVFALSKGIPLPMIIEEQRYLINKYGDLIGTP